MAQDISTPQTDNIYTQIGKIVSAMGLLETIIVKLFSQVSKIEFGLILSIVAGEKFETILKMLDSIFAYLVKEEIILQEFNALLIELRNINTQRNIFIHSMWFQADDTHFTALKFVKGGKGKPFSAAQNKIDIPTLEKLHDDIFDSIAKIMAFKDKYFPEEQGEQNEKP